MDNNNNKNQSKNEDIYSSLKGYFPEQYDMSPDELEKEIVTETKKRTIALGMTDPNRTPATNKDAHTTIPTSYSSNAESSSGLSANAEKLRQRLNLSSAKEKDGSSVDEEDFNSLGESDDKSSASNQTDEEFDIRDMFAKRDEDSAADSGTVVFTPDVVETLNEDDFKLDSASQEKPSNNNAKNIKYKSLDDIFNETATIEKVLPDRPEEAEFEDFDEAMEMSEEIEIKRVDWFFDFLEVFAICLAAIIFCFSFVGRLTKVDGASMNDTLIDGEYLIVSDLFYKPTAGDIVVLQDTAVETELLQKPIVKRIIAVGGETVTINDNGEVEITDADGETKKLDQSFTKNEPYMGSACSCYVPDGFVFVMGDNRNNSTDSRDYRLGVVDERCIFGKAYLRILPTDKFTVFKNPYEE